MASEYEFPKNYGKESGESAKENNLRDYSESRFINRGRMDLPFLVLTILILTVGVIMVFSASFARSYYETGNAAGVFLRQLIFAVGGVALMIVASRVKPKTIRRYSRLLMMVSVGLLALVLVIGVIGGGSRRWINLGFTTFQPSEITKLAVETCVWPLYEVIEGKYILSYRPKNKLPVEEYLKRQGRFAHMFKPGNEWMIQQVQQEVDRAWEELLTLCGE